MCVCVVIIYEMCIYSLSDGDEVLSWLGEGKETPHREGVVDTRVSLRRKVPGPTLWPERHGPPVAVFLLSSAMLS